MDKQEIMHYWYYFCSLCSRLDSTRQYIDHRVVVKGNTAEFENGLAYSDAFMQILLLTSSEFETIAKLLCKEAEPGFKGNSNIVEISKTILKHFPKIGDTIVRTDFREIHPFDKWRIGIDANGNSRVEGLKWWDEYTNIKHRRYECFKMANLENCVMALSSLLVLELYLAMKVLGSVSNLSSHACPYFHFRYGHEAYWVRCPDNLPDF